MSDKKYYEVTYEELLDGVKFKFKKLNPMEHLSLCTSSQTWEKVNGSDYTTLYNSIFKNILCTKNDKDWFPLVDDLGNCKLQEIEDNISVCLDLYFLYKKEVINPVFTESKTFQNLTK